MPLPSAQRHNMARAQTKTSSAKRSGLVAKPWVLRLTSLRDTHRLGRALGQAAQGGDVLALFGNLGSGKTTLVRGVAKGLRAEPASVSSPTFTLIQEYPGRLRLIHTDLYRLTGAQLEDTGLSEYLDDRTVLAVEWAERWDAGIPADRLDIELEHRTPDTRRATLTPHGPSASRWLAAVRAKLRRRSATGASRRTRVQSRRSRRASR